MNIELKKVVPEDFEFSFKAKKQAMGPHIEFKWGWDEEFQLKLHKQRWHEKPWYIVIVNDDPVGTLSLHELPNNILRFGEFYLLDSFRNKGIGSNVMKLVLDKADESLQKVILEYLKWNPVGSLYKRHGFSVVSENEIHYFMERKPKC